MNWRIRCILLVLVLTCCLSINWNQIGKERLNILRNRRFLRIQDSAQLNRFQHLTEEMKIAAPWNAPAFVWNFAWQLNQKIIPWLHVFDHCYAVDSSYNLAILWCKAITGNRWGSRLWDAGIAFDLLPPIFRWIVQFPLCWLYPNLHHQNVALRTAFLDSALKSELSTKSNETLNITQSSTCNNARVIVLGSGHDTRSLRFANIKEYVNMDGLQPEFWEIDLPSVVRTRRLMLERFVNRRSRKIYHIFSKKDTITIVPSLVGVDLNKLDDVRSALADILTCGDRYGYGKVIFVVEAVLMYLGSDVVQPLLSLCVDSARAARPMEVSLIFADRFPGVCDGGGVPLSPTANTTTTTTTTTTMMMMTADEERAAVVEAFLRPTGLTLKKWMPKPGRARHMGIASLSVPAYDA